MPPVHGVARRRCPASDADFYLADGVAGVPTFGAPSDERALATLRELWAGRDVVGIPRSALVLELGAVHCLTQQEPTPRTGAVATRGDPEIAFPRA